MIDAEMRYEVRRVMLHMGTVHLKRDANDADEGRG
jgi:hypothetical protein